MIQKLILNNFEGHVDTTIDFQKGVTIIKGNSGAGKSTIFRAFRFVFLNEPGGEEFINFNADEAEVTLIYDGHTITRAKARKNKRNEYVLDGKVLKAFGQSVPEEILSVLKLNPINFEWQFDKRPYLINETGGQIAQRLNEVVNLDLIDISLKNIEQNRRATNKDISQVEEQIKDIKPKIASYDWIEDAEKELVIIEKLEKDCEDNKRDYHDMNTIHSNNVLFLQQLDSIITIPDNMIVAVQQDIVGLQKDKISYQQMSSFANDILVAEDKLQYLNVIPSKYVDDAIQCLQQYNVARTTLKQATDALNNYTIAIATLESIGNLVSDRRLQKLSEECIQLENQKKDIYTLEGLLTTFEITSNMLEGVEYELEELQKEWDKIKPDTCPLCGGEFHEEL